MSLLEQFKNNTQDLVDDGTELDMSTASTGGGERYVLPEGSAIGRLVSYIEVGKKPMEYQGQAKPPALHVRLGFALYGEGYQRDDGKPRIIRSFAMNLSNNEKAKTFKLFKRMNYKGIHKNFAQMLGETFIVPIKHKAGAKGAVYANIDFEQIAPGIEPISRRPYEIPTTPDEMYQLFLWNNPTLEQWNSIHIEGDNNFLQEECLSAVDFPNSKLDQLLNGSMPSMAVQTDDDVPF